MQLIRDELVRARAKLETATDPHSRRALEGVILALNWVFEGNGARPSDLAALVVAPPPDPLDHDGDGKKGGSKTGKTATARKRGSK